MSHHRHHSTIAPIPVQGGFMVSLRLDVRHGLVVGGGEVATQRVRSLLAAGAQVKVVAPQVSPELRRRIAWGEVAWSERVFEDRDLQGMSVVLVGIDDPVESRRIAQLARSQRILVNVADVPPLCDFYFPAVHREGPVTIAVSTNGAAPGLASRIRDEVAATLPEGLAQRVLAFSQLRREVRLRIVDRRERMAHLRQVASTWALGEVSRSRSASASS